MPIKKNRDRDGYTFANINLLGRCNADCYFCLGKDIADCLAGKYQLNVHFSEWANFDTFLKRCQTEGIEKLYMTGQTADGLQYRFLYDLICYLQIVWGFKVGVRTNGYLALAKMVEIQTMQEEIGYSIHTLDPETNEKIMGRRDIPDWDRIIPESGDNVRVAIVLNRYNIHEFDDLVRYISKFPNVRYIQVRRISTDTREDLLARDIEEFEQFYEEFLQEHSQQDSFQLAQGFRLHGKPVYFWRTVETSANSLNYFTDGTVSDEYFIVEGYLKYKD
jgi:MoaA/NifB/PqqE/SkfB family radical SAM enzyme